MRFSQIDVFTDELTRGNALAVVHDAEGLSDERMAAFARWTNLSETTFLLPPADPAADYRVRIFTVERELPFAGHPTLGSARAWLEAGGEPKGEDLVQECGVGLVPVRRGEGRLAFAAPPLRRQGPVDDADLEAILRALHLTRADLVDAQWADNGPGWVALLLKDAEAVLGVERDVVALGEYKVGLVGPGGDADFEVRAFTGVAEDPVTGSLNAAIGQWLIGTGRAPEAYVAAQGTRLGRRGRVHVHSAGGDVWVGGDTVVGISGRVTLR
ncbi:PhzF family phenazine biosynthesis protein [Amycolatopsis sp. FDAARGOS 1241]|uniref:PhzF family phenazine biosynthesis protein n=1 Tax=Amycolatopsis sp. FDAARGOS 1241 TaxID=2778070 RepID=UPI0019510BCD|nr:PhzF family phenazine biosynthesis protein [Amycolatopsis sp. FDAARGOS 1241]QRP48706.1 PhzF family phenazine biosynthesis protein [Amycolatopsis sp. FDAARGOS 1241]